MANSTMKRFCATALLGLMLSTTAVPVTAQTLDDLAARGEILAAADPLAAELRSRLDGPGQRGFDIGMGGTEGDTLPGPGKQARGEALPADQQAGYFAAVLYSITRNANLDALLTGARVAQGNAALTDARQAEDDPFYTLGFDIATGLLYNKQGGIGDLALNLSASNVRSTLSGVTQRGFDASARLHGSNYGSFNSKSTADLTPPGDYAATDGTTDGTAGVDRVGSVPNVVGLKAFDAEESLKKAGYEFTEVTVKGTPTRPPFDVVVGTVPPAGTTLVAGSNVRYQTVEAAILNGTGTLNQNDFDNRIAFDLDTGKYAQITHGGDIYMVPLEKLRCIELEKVAGYPVSKCSRGASLLEAGDGATVAILKVAYEYNGTHGIALKSRRYFTSCHYALSKEPPKAKIIVGDYYIDKSNSFGDRVVINTVCVRTAEGNLSVVRFAPEESNGNFQFEFASFPDYQVLKAQGRVKIDPVPGAPPSALSQLSICEKAKWARDRNSPAAPGLTKQCLDSGGTVPQ